LKDKRAPFCGVSLSLSVGLGKGRTTHFTMERVSMEENRALLVGFEEILDEIPLDAGINII
jgi:hypothetical protein